MLQRVFGTYHLDHNKRNKLVRFAQNWNVGILGKWVIDKIYLDTVVTKSITNKIPLEINIPTSQSVIHPFRRHKQSERGVDTWEIP